MTHSGTSCLRRLPSTHPREGISSFLSWPASDTGILRRHFPCLYILPQRYPNRLHVPATLPNSPPLPHGQICIEAPAPDSWQHWHLHTSVWSGNRCPGIHNDHKPQPNHELSRPSSIPKPPFPAKIFPSVQRIFQPPGRLPEDLQ